MTECESEKRPKTRDIIAKMKLRKQKIEYRNKKRRLKNRRLIQYGKLTEKYFACEGMSPIFFKRLIKRVIACPELAGILRNPASSEADSITGEFIPVLSHFISRGNRNRLPAEDTAQEADKST